MADSNHEPEISEGEPRPESVAPAASAAVPRRPDELVQFRVGRLLILLEVVPALPNRKPFHLERLGYYDFFADNPFLVFDDDSPRRRELLLAGFTQRNLSYHSSAQRFANRRARLQHDLALLVARGLVEVGPDGSHVAFALSDTGRDAAAQLASLYASSYRRSAEIVGRELNRLSDKALGARAQEWLRAESFLIDLYEGVDAA